MSCPIVVMQCFSGYIDLYAAASWLAALLALTWAARAKQERPRRGLLMVAGLSAGVALGSKTTFLVLVPLLGVVAMAVEWIRPRAGRCDRPRPIRNLALFSAAALVCSGFWFVRGTVQAGNPVYPLGIKIGERTVLPGFTSDDFFPTRTFVQRLSRWWDYPWRETKYSGSGYPYSVNNGVGAVYAAFVPLGLLAAVLSRGTRRPRTVAQKWRLVYVLFSLSGCVLLVTAFHDVLRYVLPQMLLAAPVAAVLIDRLMTKFPRSVLVTLTVAVTTVAAVATLRPAHALLGRARGNVWDRAAFYGMAPLMDELPPGACVLNLADPARTYALLGKNFSNVVISPARWRVLLDGEPISARFLREHAVDYIYMQTPWPDDWPDDLPVETVYDDSDTPRIEGVPATRIYRVVEDGEGKDAHLSSGLVVPQNK